jgi:hypothetical protein
MLCSLAVREYVQTRNIRPIGENVSLIVIDMAVEKCKIFSVTPFEFSLICQKLMDWLNLLAISFQFSAVCSLPLGNIGIFPFYHPRRQACGYFACSRLRSRCTGRLIIGRIPIRFSAPRMRRTVPQTNFANVK